MPPADRRAILFAGLLVVSGVATPASADPGGELPNSTSNEHFVVKYADGYESSAETTLKHLREIRSQLQAATPADTAIPGKITVRLHPIGEWEDGNYSLHWHNDPNRIDLIAPSDWRTVEGVDEYYIRKNLAHEYANILLYEYVEAHDGDYWSRYPSWFGEGLSEYYAYHNVSADIRANYDPGVSEFERKVKQGSGYFSVIAADRYSGGHLLMHYVLDEYGERKVFELLRSDAESFPDIVHSELNVSYDVFKKRWLLWAETNVGGDYSVSEASVSKSERIDSLKQRLDRKNETISSYRYRLDRKNATIADLREKVESLNRSLRQARRNASRPLRAANEETTRSETPSTTADTGSRTNSPPFVAGLAGGSVLGLAAAGAVFLFRR